jgi:hypothetical protein
MSCQPKGQGDYRQSRISTTAGRKYRATGDKEIRYTMHSAIGIHHTVPRIVMHPRSAQEVVCAVESRLRGDSSLERDESADTSRS